MSARPPRAAQVGERGATGRVDTRLVPAAVAAWAAAAGATAWGSAGRAALAVGAAGLVGYALRLALRRARAAHRARWSHPAPAILLAGLAALAAVSSVFVQDAVRTPAVLAAAIGGGRAAVLLEVASPPSRASPGPDGASRVSLAATLVTLDSAAPGPAPAGSSEPHVERRFRSPVRVFAPAAQWASLVPGQVVATEAALRPTRAGDRPVALLLPTPDAQVTLLRPAPAPLALAARVRADLRAAAEPLPGHAQLLPGIAVGDDDAVPPALADAMSATSLGHLLAVSGAHVAIVLGLVLVAVGAAAVWLRVAVGATVLAALVLLVGPEPSVIRASGMGVVLLLAQVLGRRGQALSALAAAVVVLVVADPWIASAVGFVLSVSATAGIVLLAGPLTERLAPRLGRAGALAPALAVPLAAQLACLPALLLVDPGIATYAVPANALVAPVIPPVTLLGLGAACLAGFWVDGARLLLWAATPGTWWIDQVATRLADAPLARLPWPGGMAGLALAAALVGAGWLTRGFLRSHGVALTAGALALVVVAALLPGTRGEVGARVREVWSPVPTDWGVVGCDVDQGTAVLVALGPGGGAAGGVAMLDVGPSGGAAVACLRAAGVSSVEALVLSHADLDHVGGLGEVLDVVGVARAYLPAAGDPRLADVRSTLEDAGVPVTEMVVPDGVGAAPAIQFGASTAYVLWPTERAVALAAGSAGAPGAAAASGSGEAASANGLSLAVLLRTPTLTVLSPGDLGAREQAALMRSPPAAAALAGSATGGAGAGGFGVVDVSIVPHHGSSDADPDYLARTAGRVALVSVGADNRYGHPAPWVLAELLATGAYVLRTDECGTVTVRRLATGELAVTACP